MAYFLHLFIGRELNSAVGHYSQAVDSITSHIALEAFFLPHPYETRPHSLILSLRGAGLDLPEGHQSSVATLS